MSDPLITIGITCFNAQDTIERAIRSALAQQDVSFEIIVVDDCSTDESIKIINGIEDTRVHLISHESNCGPAAARQSILDNAKGIFVAFFDDDDVSEPERCKMQYQKILSYEKEAGNNLVACYCSGIRYYPNGYEYKFSAIGSRPEIPKGQDIPNYVFFYEKRNGIFYGAGTPTCTLMARKSTFDVAGGFDPAFRRVEDIDFAVRLALAGGHFIGCEEPLLKQFSTGGIDKVPEKNLHAELQLVEKHKNYLISVHMYAYARRWPYIRYYHFKHEYAKMVFVLIVLFLLYPIKTVHHFLQTAPKRLLHELRMRKTS